MTMKFFVQLILLLFFFLSLSSCSTLRDVALGTMNFEVLHYANAYNDGEAEQKTTTDLNLNVYKATYENGLRVLISPNHTLPIFSFYTFFDVGGRYEREGTTGATHFLEHMMFKGARKYGPGEFDTAIESSGGRTNAYTSFDATVYFQHLPSHMLNLIIDMEADRMTDILLIPQAFESERQVIFNERKMRYENSPQGQLYLGMMQNFFKSTPYGGSVIGSVEDLTRLDRDEVKEFFHKFYTPDNAIIVITGDVDPEETFKEIARRYHHLSPSDEELQEYKNEKDAIENYKRSTEYGKHVRLQASTPEPIFSLAFGGEARGTRRGHVLSFVAQILAGGESSYLHQHFVSGSRPMLTSLSANNFQLKHDGIFFLMGALRPNVNLSSFKSSLISRNKRACREAITDRSVQKVRNQILYGLYSGLSTNEGLASFLGNNELFFGDFRTYREQLAIIDSITIDEIKTVCHELFQGDKYLFTTVEG